MGSPDNAAGATPAGEPDALFEPLGGDLVRPTLLCRSPWAHGGLHGGAVTGLTGWAVERAAPPGLQLSRLTVEIWSSVPLAPLRVTANVARPGRRVAVVDAAVFAGDRQVARATSQWVAANGSDPLTGPRPPAAPARPATPYDPAAGDFDYPRPGFNCDAAELRSVLGNTEDPGPGIVWARLRHPVMAGEPLTPLQRAAALADLGAAVGWEWSPSGAAMINPDVTLQLNRYPAGPWVCIDSRSRLVGSGVGLIDTVLSDDEGLFGRVLQSQVESPHEFTRHDEAAHA